MANPLHLRVYLPTQEASSTTTIRTVDRPAGDGADLLGHETVGQIVNAAVRALRGDDVSSPGGAVQRLLPRQRRLLLRHRRPWRRQ